MNEKIAAIVPKLDLEHIVYHLTESLKPYTYWKIGGPCDLMIEPDSAQQIIRILSILNNSGIPYAVIGDGTNLLVHDDGFSGVVIKIGRRMSGIERLPAEDSESNSTAFRIYAGTWTPLVAHTLGRLGYTGLEHTIGIPGTFGGLVFMNGGSLKKSIGEVIETVTVVDRDGSEKKIPRADCGFAYRSSRFQDSNEIVVEADIHLEKGDHTSIINQMHKILYSRRLKFPRKLPSCGSVFKNDPKLYNNFGPPGKVIEDLGFKGMRIGGAAVSVKHANFIVNDRGTATAKDVMALVNQIRSQVYQHTGIMLEQEFRVLRSPDVNIV
jgi:UDP-N-acetylmuramate dehydrogenase